MAYSIERNVSGSGARVTGARNGSATCSLNIDGTVEIMVTDDHERDSGPVWLESTQDAVEFCEALTAAVRGLTRNGTSAAPRTVAAALRDRIENKCGLEPSFSSLDDGGDAVHGEKDPEKRFAVYDAEMEVVCRCEKPEHANLIRDLLNQATA